jgi:sulfite reductase beta subunit-like hemoprotein
MKLGRTGVAAAEDVRVVAVNAKQKEGRTKVFMKGGLGTKTSSYTFSPPRVDFSTHCPKPERAFVSALHRSK